MEKEGNDEKMNSKRLNFFPSFPLPLPSFFEIPRSQPKVRKIND